MTKEDILHHFQDINFYYGDCMMYADLSGMLDELIAENKCFDGMTNGEVIQALFDGLVIHDNPSKQKYTIPMTYDFWNAPYQKGGE